jgi:DNA-binding LacI/PurR family transcriptional regulator
MMGKKVLMVGWHPSVVDYANYPGLTAEKLEGALRLDEQKLNAQGYDASIGFIFSGATAIDQLADKLRAAAYDVVMIGAGVRKDDDHFLIFEKLVNIVHELAPQARIAFNTGPTDSEAAIRRWA